MTEALVEKYLDLVAKQFSVDKLKASEYIDECIKQTSATLNIKYSDVYSTIYSEEQITKCLITSKKCSEMEIEECKRSCSCFVLDDKCFPRVFPDAEEINEDPDTYIKKHIRSTKELEEMVKVASFLYYNFEGGGLTDNSFDALEYELNKRLKQRGRRYEKIGAPPVEKIRIRLPYPLPSLDKVKPGMHALNKFLSKFIPEKTAVKEFQSQSPEIVNPMYRCFWSLKLDGVSGMITYNGDGELSGIYTRGDGEIGGDVTYLKDYLATIPSEVSKSNLVVRGEFIMKKSVWKEKYEGVYVRGQGPRTPSKLRSLYTNARSFVSGKINAGYVSPSLPDIDFVAYSIMSMEDKKRVPSPTQSLKILYAENFTVVDSGVCVSPTVFDYMQLYKSKRQSSTYSIDGLVLTGDWSKLAVEKGSSPFNPLDTVAFKMLLEEQIRSTKVTIVEWNLTRYGRYFPTVVYESVYIEGIRLHRATGHNARHIANWNMGKGTRIKVVRSGDVIPQIKDVDVDQNTIAIFPKSYEEGGHEWHWKGADILLDEIEGNPEVQLKRTVHFFSTLGVPKLKEGNVKRFTDAGYKMPEQISKLSVEEIMKIKGFGQKSATQFYENIKKALSTSPPDRFLVATTSFKSGIGRKLSKQLFTAIPTILNMSTEEIVSTLKERKLRGFGPARIKNVSINIPQFRKYLDSFAKEEIQHAITYYTERLKRIEEEGANPLIKGKTFVFTGFMGSTDYELEDYIYDHKGIFSSNVTSGTEAVVSKSIANITSKMIQAYELKVPVLDIYEFSRQYNIPLRRFSE